VRPTYADAVATVLGWLAAGQTHQKILDDFPE